MIKEFFKTVLYQPLFNLLIFIAWLVPGHSLGWAIIGLTIIVRILIWPLTIKPLLSSLHQRQFQPELKELREKYKDDRAAQAQAQMAFFKEKGINPLAGCLPALIQLPILLILYRVFITGLKSERLDLLYSFTPHVAVNPIFFGIDLGHPNRLVFPLIAAGLQFFQTKHMQKLNPVSGDKNDPTAAMTKQMVFLFPIMTFVVALSLPAGLALYWAVAALAQWLQQLYVERNFKPTASKVAVSVRSKK
jgi:YidC/Oxa1 family membrane protein insertase